jgi:hypothetical protein
MMMTDGHPNFTREERCGDGSNTGSLLMRRLVLTGNRDKVKSVANYLNDEARKKPSTEKVYRKKKVMKIGYQAPCTRHDL